MSVSIFLDCLHCLCQHLYIIFTRQIADLSIFQSILGSNKSLGGSCCSTCVRDCRLHGQLFMHAIGLFFSFVCVSAQQSEKMSVSGEDIDEHTHRGTKRLANENTQQPQHTKTAVQCRSWFNSANVFLLKAATVLQCLPLKGCSVQLQEYFFFPNSSILFCPLNCFYFFTALIQPGNILKTRFLFPVSDRKNF